MSFRAVALFLVSASFFIRTFAANPIILISIDGLRPDAIKKANATNILGLMATGTYFENALTVRPSLTLPSHTSMLTGLDPVKHGITWDDYRPFYGPVKFTTVLEVAHTAGLHTAAFVAKDKLLTLNRPNSTDHFELTDKDGDDVASAFTRYVEQSGLPDLTFIHLPDPDKIGHFLGWMSPFYIDQVENADDDVGQIVAVANGASEGVRPTIILTADHGGSGFNHFLDIYVHNHIPFLINGDGIPSGQVRSEVVRVYDAAPTILSMLGLPIPNDWLGKPVQVIDKKLEEPAQQCLASGFHHVRSPMICSLPEF